MRTIFVLLFLFTTFLISNLMRIIRSLLFFLSFCFCISLSAKNWADVNGDETVNISDVVAVINTISGNKSFMDTADVNCDGNVNISDVVAVVNIMAGQETDMDDPAVAAGFCPNSHHPHFINMGDGRKWSCCNEVAIPTLTASTSANRSMTSPRRT